MPASDPRFRANCTHSACTVASLGRAQERELRGAITAYDAAYVALAEQFDVPLLTCDARLGGSNGHRAEIVVYPRS